MDRPATFSQRLAGPGDAARGLAADPFDGPAGADRVARFLGDLDPDPRHLRILAEIDAQVAGFASGVVLDHSDKAPQLFVI